ncbi:hypothetical protein C8R45DRAFT_954115 [Mycena sanguinolenta]|nr:hypothetical protein C8R45DRAFT_954115 [Mycena sanguinolenta]
MSLFISPLLHRKRLYCVRIYLVLWLSHLLTSTEAESARTAERVVLTHAYGVPARSESGFPRAGIPALVRAAPRTI